VIQTRSDSERGRSLAHAAKGDVPDNDNKMAISASSDRLKKVGEDAGEGEGEGRVRAALLKRAIGSVAVMKAKARVRARVKELNMEISQEVDSHYSWI
jgi:hypothetical protein